MLKEVLHGLFRDIQAGDVLGLHFLDAFIGIIDLGLDSRDERAICNWAIRSASNFCPVSKVVY